MATGVPFLVAISKRREPDLIFTSEAGTLRQTADVTVLPFRVAAAVAGASGIVAALLGVIGLYGVIAYLPSDGDAGVRSRFAFAVDHLADAVACSGGRPPGSTILLPTPDAFAAARSWDRLNATGT